MATRTISNAGGNWASIGTWVEGAVPLSTDAVVATATSGNVTINSAVVCQSANFTNYVGTLSCSGGSLTPSGSVTLASGMTISGTSTQLIYQTSGATLTCNGKTWGGDWKLNAGFTFNCGDACSIAGALLCTGGTMVLNGQTLSVAGGITMTTTLSGTTAITLTGGTWSGNAVLKNNLTLAGNVTVSGTVGYSTGTLTYSSGTITTSGSTINVALGTTFNTNGMSWNNITVSSSTTVTLNSLLSASTLTLSSSTSGFNGTAGFTVATLAGATAGITYTFQINNTYTITSSITATGTSGSKITFKSNSAGTQTNIVLQSGATQDLSFVSATDVNSSGGQTFWTFKGTLSNATNWKLLAPPVTVAWAYC